MQQAWLVSCGCSEPLPPLTTGLPHSTLPIAFFGRVLKPGRRGVPGNTQRVNHGNDGETTDLPLPLENGGLQQLR